MLPEPVVHVPSVYNGICIGHKTDQVVKRADAAHRTFQLVADHVAIAPTLLERGHVCSTARELFTALYLTGVLSHQKVEATLAIILWIACKLHGYPRLIVSELLNAMGCPLMSDWNMTYFKVVQAVLQGVSGVNVRTVTVDGCVKHIIEM